MDIPKYGNMAKYDTGNLSMAIPKDTGGMTLAVANLNLTMDAESERIIALGRVLDEFRRLNPNMPVAQIQAFLMVALDTGLGMTEISNATGIKNSTTSRYLMEMGAERILGDGSFGLVDRGVDPQNPRKARYTLTKRGQKLVGSIVAILAGDVR